MGFFVQDVVFLVATRQVRPHGVIQVRIVREIIAFICDVWFAVPGLRISGADKYVVNIET